MSKQKNVIELIILCSFISVHDVQPYASDMFNTTHHIRKLSFGTEIESAPDGLYTSPLDGHVGVAKEGMK